MRRTPLYEEHRAAAARFTEFGGWEMPVQYRGILAEHAAVRTKVGLFDVSHMGEIEVTGPGALALCQRVTTNDASRIVVGQAQYTPWCDENGGTIDDTILYRLGGERYMFCVNASNAGTCADWIQEQARAHPEAQVRDRSLDLSLIAVQGPAAAELVRRCGGDATSRLPRFGCGEDWIADAPVIAARTGYTGEDGFELFVANEYAAALWRVLLSRGADLGAEPIGLGARDTLRLEAGLPLYGHELGREISPLEAGLGWAVKLDKGDFAGRDRLVEQKTKGLTRRLVGIGLTSSGIAREGYPVLVSGSRVGAVTSGTKSPSLGRAIALALIATGSLDAALHVEIRGRPVPAERVPLPFYRRAVA